ncbi:hypothetical protein [Flavobacterium daemonense]|uniref:hypothetical protein n=1 Tax=Flavobacterium daemonense TaxID=1393049 RepID=UPI001185068C|nr:hypothetical protein [Flavobacterium daemonense]KAF2333779.1 hypothetical protein FND99_09930 [Flavobacterium daemonense]
MEIFDKDFDYVINGVVATGAITYEEALDKLIPLINKTDFQRKLQDKKFYEKLEKDIEKGCIMPAITIAYVDETINDKSTTDDVLNFFNTNFKESFVLDGIQRLNTLERLRDSEYLDKKKKLYVNVIFSNSVDKLLYRMITLNNGQKPMTPRHQVEVMMANYNFEAMGIRVQSEKDRAEKIDQKSFNKSDLIQAYLAYMANSPLIDNKKIIEEKMNELLVSKIISADPVNNYSDFHNVLLAISKFQHNPVSLKWLKQANNLVGFAVGMRSSYELVLELTEEEFTETIQKFDKAFSDFNPSKIKLGKFRRELTCEYFQRFSKLKEYDELELLEHFSSITNE